MRDEPNLSALEAALAVEELARYGVRHAIIAPGSRSAALVVAAVKHPKIDVKIHVDERGAAFRAVGVARATGRPAMVITTSGTAVANLLPAAVEAAMDRVPLLLLTADRPPELHDVGANQAIYQHDLFRPFSRGFANLPPPEAPFSPRALLETVDSMFRAATEGSPGPVQLNVQLREPLAPHEADWDRGCLDEIADWLESDSPFARIATAPVEVANLERVVEDLSGAHRPLVVLGAIPGDRGPVRHLVRALGWAVFADVRSGFRLGQPELPFLPHFDRALEWLGPRGPDVVLQLGGRVTSRRLLDHLSNHAPRAYVLVDPNTSHPDPTHHVTRHVRVPPSAIARALGPHAHALVSDPVEMWADKDSRIEAVVRDHMDGDDTLSEPYVARWLTQHAPTEHSLFVSNSMPIRDVQSFGAVDGPALEVRANRGASGIDGVVSTALGCAEGTGRPVTLLIGDLALLHDLNALSAFGAAGAQVIVVVMNNRGGSIFSFLPIADHEEVFSPWFDTPHDVTFEGAAASFGLGYARVEARERLAAAYHDAVSSGRSVIIEIVSGQAENRGHHARFDAAVREAMP